MSEDWTEETMQAILVNPFYAIEIAPVLCSEHPPLVDQATWIRANVRAMEEMGAEEWLKLLLRVLETGGVTASDDEAHSDISDSERLSRPQRRLKARRLARKEPQG